MSTAQRLTAYLKMALAGAACLGAAALTTPAHAQLNYGDVVTVNSYMNSSNNGRIYRHWWNGSSWQRTQIGGDWSWTNRPLAVLVESPSTLLVAVGTYTSYSSYTPRLVRVDVATGNQTPIGNFPSWQYQPIDLERHPVTGQVYMSTGLPHVSQDSSSFYGVWRLDTSNATLQRQTRDLDDTYGRRDSPMQMAIDPTNPNNMYFTASYYQSSNTGYSYRTDLSNLSPNDTVINSHGWDLRPGSVEFVNGQLWAGRGTYSSSNQNGRISTTNTSFNSFTDQGTTWSWPQATQRLGYDETNNRLWSTHAYHTGTGQTSFIRYRDLNTNTTVDVNNIGWDFGYWDLDVLNFGLLDTEKNNLVIDASTANAAGSPNFRSTDSNGTVAVSDLLTALGANSAVSARAGFGGANNQDGDVTLATALDFNNIDNKTLLLRASDDITIGGAISDSDVATSAENLNVTLLANNQNKGGTGAVNLNAAVALGTGTFSASGKSVNASAPITTTGATTLAATSGGVTAAALTTGATTVTATGNVALNGVVTTGGATSVTTTGGSVAAAENVTVGGNLTVQAATSANFAKNVSATGSLGVTAPIVNVTGTLDGGATTLAGSTSVRLRDDATVASLTASGGTFTVDQDLTSTGDIGLNFGGQMHLKGDTTANNFSTAGTGNFRSDGLLTVNGTLTLAHTGGVTQIANLSADALAVDASQVVLAAGVDVTTLALGTNTLTVGSGATVEADVVTQSGSGGVSIFGGRFAGPASTGSFVKLNAGTFNVLGNVDVEVGSPITNIFATAMTLKKNQTLQVDGDTTLQTGVTLDGGTLRTQTLANGGLLTFKSGEVELTGDAAAFNIATGGTFANRLTLGSGQKLTVSGDQATLTIAAGGGVLTINGGEVSINRSTALLGSAPSLINNGQVVLSTLQSQVGGNGALINNGTIGGTGRVMNDLITNAGALSVAAGAELTFGGDLENTGTIDFLGAATGPANPAKLVFQKPVTNRAGATITGQAGTIFFPNAPIVPGDAPYSAAAAGLINRGSVLITSPVATNIHGSVFQVGGSAKTIISNGALINFHGDVFNYDADGNPLTTTDAAELRVGDGAGVVFLGAYQGSGRLTGNGTKFFKGGFNPGQSPGALAIEGSVEFADSTVLTMELAGPAAGTQYDTLHVQGNLTLDGTLNIALLGGYQPALGASFDLLTFGSALGGFDDINAPFQFEVTQTGGSYTLTVVPEPTTAALALGGLALLARRRRR